MNFGSSSWTGTFFGSVTQRLQARFYSISSSPHAHQGRLHITCAVVKEATATGRLHEGVCSYTFKRAAPGDFIPIMVRHSTLRLPADPLTPVIMVGPGSGLAPFRGFLHERSVLKAAGALLVPDTVDCLPITALVTVRTVRASAQCLLQSFCGLVQSQKLCVMHFVFTTFQGPALVMQGTTFSHFERVG